MLIYTGVDDDKEPYLTVWNSGRNIGKIERGLDFYFFLVNSEEVVVLSKNDLFSLVNKIKGMENKLNDAKIESNKSAPDSINPF